MTDFLSDLTGHPLSFRLSAAEAARGYSARCTACGECFRDYDDTQTVPCIPTPDHLIEEWR